MARRAGGSPSWSRRCRWAATVLLAAALVGGVTEAPAAAATPTTPPIPAAHKQKAVPVRPVAGDYRKPVVMPAWRPDMVTWPSGAATVVAAGSSARPLTDPHLTVPTPAVANGTEAGTLPVWIGPATSGKAAATQPAPTMRVQVAPRSASTAVGVRGVLLSVGRTNPGSGQVHVTLDYGTFADAFGGDWASRLHLVRMPACALTTPAAANCRTETPVGSTNDAHARTVSADVPTNGTAAVVLAATSDPGGGGGDYTATTLKPSGKWQAGGAADDFTYQYPIDVPDVPGGLVPQVNLTYDSQSVDGLTSSTNNQASWIGDGWEYSPGYVERSYQSCQQNPAGATKTSDDCWSADNQLTLSLDGQNTVLVRGADGDYHPQNDDNSLVVAKTGGTNGSQGGEYFVLTAADGTQYYFGLNELPGFGPGDATTNSVWTEPIYSTKSFPDEPAGCFNATFSLSHCQLAYRWNLDYVVDPHADAVSYFYATEANFYAQDKATKAATTSYVRGGRLTRIQYGQRDQQVYSTKPAAQVLFNSGGRCAAQTSCDPATLTSTTATQWPDVPFDLNCASGAACQTQAPTFWSDYQLNSVETDVLVGTTETPVDTWTLKHTFPAVADPNTKPSLWLSSITHTGDDTTGGGSTAAQSVPAITFTGTPKDNRVANITDGFPMITRERLTDIVTETGEDITVDYTNSTPSAAACSPTSEPANPSSNTALCYPDFWTPTGQVDPRQDWFYKYIVASVTETDPTDAGVNDDVQTTYQPIGGAAWHYNDSPVTPTTPVDQRTWDQWRGFSGMIVSTGTAPDPVQNTRYTYFRGMDGDTLPAGATRHATVSDVHGDPPATDSNQFAGVTYETVEYDGTPTAANIVTDTVTDPFSTAATASQAMPSPIPTLQSFVTGTKDTREYTPLAGGGTQATEDDYTHDAQGRVTQENDRADLSTTSDDLCTTTSYADNTSAHILNLVAEKRVVSVACGTTPTFPRDAVSDELTYYDGGTTPGAVPTKGDITESQDAITYTGSAATSTYATTTSTFDEYGRTLTSTDPDGRKTTTAYTPLTGAEPTSEKVTDPLLHATTTTYDPLRELPRTVTDPSGLLTTEQYDALGRLTAVYRPGNPAAGLVPDYKFSYAVSATAPSTVATFTRTNGSTYQESMTLYDALLRAREVQTQVLGGGRTIADTMYNTSGLVSETTDPYPATGAVSGTYVEAQVGDVPSATGTAYDGDGRKVSETAFAHGVQTWETTYGYGGNSTTTVPPAGGTATTTITDARGNQTDIIQYHAGVPVDPADPPADYSDTHFTYTPAGDQATVEDAAGNTWSYTYDLLGDKTSSSDPDTGRTVNTYDAAGQLLTTTDGRGKQTSYTYDKAGRKTAEYDTTGGATESSLDQLGSWTYDTLQVGELTSSTANSNGDTVTDTVTGYTNAGLPEGTTTTISGRDAGLLPASGFTTSYGYNVTGDMTTETLPAAAGLPAESIQYGYDAFGEPDKTSSTGVMATNYVNAVGYDQFGKPLQYTMPATAGNVTLTLAYDPQTQRLTDATTTDSNQATAVDDTTYGYSSAAVSAGAGLVTSTTDKQDGGATTDTQCFAYDYAERLAAAWTAIDHCAATPTPGDAATVGGPAPYWQSWTYDAAGNRLSQTDHDVKGDPAGDTTTDYAYPAAGSATDQPHSLTSTTATGPQAAKDTAAYTYDASGDTTSITGGGGDHSLTWTDDGKLESDTTSAGTSTYVYDADGNLVVQRDPGKVTALVGGGDEEIDLDTATGVLTATRYYSVGDTVLAARGSLASGGVGNPVYLIPDRQGTDELAVDSNTYAVDRRQYLPFGQARTTTPDAWPGGSQGYVGGTDDSATGMENLGARQYDAATGRFLSADPVLETDDPNQLGGYDYAGNDPVTHADPTGEQIFLDCGGPCAPNPPARHRPKPKPVRRINLPGGGHISDGGVGDPFRRPVVHHAASHRHSASRQVSRSPFFRLARTTRRIHPDHKEHWWNPFSWTKHTWKKVGILGTDVLSVGAGVASMGFQAIAIGCLFIGQVECTAGAELASNVAGYVGTVADGINMGLKSGSSRPNSQGNRVTTIFDGIGLVNAATGSTKAEKTGIRAADEMMEKGLGVARAAPGFAFGIAQLAQVGGVIQDFQQYAH